MSGDGCAGCGTTDDVVGGLCQSCSDAGAVLVDGASRRGERPPCVTCNGARLVRSTVGAAELQDCPTCTAPSLMSVALDVIDKARSLAQAGLPLAGRCQVHLKPNPCDDCHYPDPVPAPAPDPEAEFLNRLGRHLRKQEGWWDDPEWSDIACRVAARFEHPPASSSVRATSEER